MGAERPRVTFGLIIPQRGSLFGLGPLRKLLELAERAEGSSLFDTIWIGDSLTSKARPEAVTCLASIAGMTERVKLAIGCMASFAVRDPALFALQWATLDQVSNGRTLLSVCNGFQTDGASEREAQNFSGISDSDRPARLEENIELLRRLWTGEVIDFDGRFSHYRGLQLELRPVQDPPPIWITANPAPGKNAERMIRRVARLADGFQGTLGSPDGLDALRNCLVENGRDPDTFPIAGYHSVNIGPDRDECLNDATRFFDNYYGSGSFAARNAAAGTAAGTVEQCIECIVDVVHSGVTHLPLRIASLDFERDWDPLTKEVLPGVLTALGY